MMSKQMGAGVPEVENIYFQVGSEILILTAPGPTINNLMMPKLIIKRALPTFLPTRKVGSLRRNTQKCILDHAMNCRVSGKRLLVVYFQANASPPRTYLGLPRPPFHYTHTRAYYRIKVGTMYHAEDFVDLHWHIIKDLGARINYQQVPTTKWQTLSNVNISKFSNIAEKQKAPSTETRHKVCNISRQCEANQTLTQIVLSHIPRNSML